MPRGLVNDLRNAQQTKRLRAVAGDAGCSSCHTQGFCSERCGNLSSMADNIKAGKLRSLVTTTPERLKDFPDVPTARKAGFPQLEAIAGWSAL